MHPSRSVERAAAAFFVQVHPLHAHDTRMWTIRLEPDLLTLMSPDGGNVMQLHREEAARYIRFAYDLRCGHTISFLVIEGLKAYAFRCTKIQILKLVDWMPHKAEEQLTREVRGSSLAVTLFGLAHIVLSQFFGLGAGIILLIGGLIGVVKPRRWAYGLNCFTMLAAGFWDLAEWNLFDWMNDIANPELSVVPIALGLTLVLWGVQQFTMLGPNQLLRVARSIRDARAAFLPERSKLVRKIAALDFAAAFIFATCAATVFVVTAGSAVPTWDSLRDRPDLAVLGVVSVLATLSGLALMLRRRPAYAEAKVSAQLFISIAILAFWGMVFSVASRAPLSFFDDIEVGTNVVFAPSVWISLIVCVAAFNRWFSRAVDRELEEQRG